MHDALHPLAAVCPLALVPGRVAGCQTLTDRIAEYAPADVDGLAGERIGTSWHIHPHREQ